MFLLQKVKWNGIAANKNGKYLLTDELLNDIRLKKIRYWTFPPRAALYSTTHFPEHFFLTAFTALEEYQRRKVKMFASDCFNF